MLPGISSVVLPLASTSLRSFKNDSNLSLNNTGQDPTSGVRCEAVEILPTSKMISSFSYDIPTKSPFSSLNANTHPSTYSPCQIDLNILSVFQIQRLAVPIFESCASRLLFQRQRLRVLRSFDEDYQR